MFRYSEEFKNDVLTYLKNHTIKETCEKFKISRYSIQLWKGWKRKNSKQAHLKWKQSEKGRKYLSSLEYRKRMNSHQQKWRKNNIERCRMLDRDYKRKHVFKKLCEYSNRHFKQKDRKPFERKEYDKILPFDLWKLAKKQKLICPLSGVKLDRKTISVDHIIAKSKGGKNTLNNIRLVHVWANRMRLNHTDKQFLDFCRTIVDYNS